MTNCTLLFPQTAPCSANGQCVEEVGECTCSPGWTSIGDFISSPHLDCDIHISTLSVIWGIVLVLSGLSIFFVIWYMYRREKYRPIRIHYNNAGTIFPLAFLVSHFCTLGLGALKVTDINSRQVGLDPLTTIFWCCYLFSAFVGGNFYVHILGKFLLDMAPMLLEAERRMIRTKFGLLDRIRYLTLALNFVFSFVLLFALAYPSRLLMIGAIHLVGTGMLVLFLVLSITYSVHVMIQSLREMVNSSVVKEQLLNIISKLSKARFILASNGIVAFVIFVIIGVLPFFFRKSSYLLAIICLANIFCTSILIYSQWNSGNKNSSDDAENVSNKHVSPTHPGNMRISKNMNVSASPIIYSSGTEAKIMPTNEIL